MNPGGHFVSLQALDLLVADIREFFRALRRPGDETKRAGRRPRASGRLFIGHGVEPCAQNR